MPVRICLNRHCGNETIVLDNCNREKEAHTLQVFFVMFLKRGYDYQWTILIQVNLLIKENQKDVIIEWNNFTLAGKGCSKS